MQSKAGTPAEYIDSLPADRKQIIGTLHDTIVKNLAKGFSPCMNYGMIGYVVPHSIYPSGYHCDPKQPLPFMALASQKNYISVYHMGMYEGELLNWFRKEWPRHTAKKLDMGKCCFRFKKPEDVPVELIAELTKKVSVKDWIDTYEENIKR